MSSARSIIAALLILFAAPAAAQTLHGRVTDAATGAPVAGARLTLLDASGGTAATAQSAADGAFRLQARAPGEYRVSAQRLGYRPTLTREVELAAGAAVEVELRMAAAPLVLDTAVARGAHGRGVHGRVVDDETGRPVPDARVTLLTVRGHVAARARTDERGAFSVRPPSPGGYSLQADAEGYRPSTTAALTLTPSDTVELELRVSERSILLAPVTVVGSSANLMRDHQLAGFEWRRRRAVHGRFMGPEEIRRLNPFHATDVVQEVPFVEVRSVGMFDKVVLLRAPYGRGRCLPTFYVDGHYLPVDTDLTLNSWISGQRLAGVEVYQNPSTAPAEFPARPIRGRDCGVVVLWTAPPGSRG